MGKLRILFSPDDGGAGGAADTAGSHVAEDTVTDNAGTTVDLAAEAAAVAMKDQDQGKDSTADTNKSKVASYLDSIDPEKRKSKDYQVLNDFETPEALADAYVRMSKRNVLELPGKDAKPEAVKAFLQKLGVPESADAYELPDNGVDPKISGPLADQMRKEFMKAGMTKRQGETMWKMFTKEISLGNDRINAARENHKQTFDARLAAKLEKAYPVKAEREGAMSEAVNLFKQHMSRTGLGKIYKDTGLIYNPDFIMAIANDEKSKGSTFVQGKTSNQKGNTNTGKFDGNYSKDFENFIGGRE